MGLPAECDLLQYFLEIIDEDHKEPAHPIKPDLRLTSVTNEFLKTQFSHLSDTALETESSMVLLGLEVFATSLDYLSLEEASDLFDDPKFQKILMVYHFYNSVCSNTGWVFYSPKDKIRILEDFITFININYDFITSTGYLPSSFDQSRFFKHWFVSFCPSKEPVGFNMNHDIKNGSIIFDSHGDNKDNLLLRYKEATHLFCEYDSKFLDDIRPKIVNLNVDAFKVIVNSLKKQDHNTIWDNVLQLMTDTISSNELEVLREIDKKADLNISKGNRNVTIYRNGFDSLIELVGQHIDGLRVNAFDEIYVLLKDFLVNNEKGDPLNYKFHSMFEAIKEYPHLYDNLLKGENLFSEFRTTTGNFWKDFKNKVNYALENEFYEEFIIRKKVRKKYARKFIPHMNIYADSVLTRLELDNMIPSDNENKSSSLENRFIYQGATWKFIFNGEEISIANCDGAKHIALLLNNPNKIFSTFELYTGERYKGTINKKPFLEREDRKIIETLKKRLKNTEYKDASEKEKMESIIKECSKTQTTNDYHKYRTHVINAIERCIAAIEKDGFKDLASYLYKNIKSGTRCIFVPINPTDTWDVKF